MKDAGYSQQFWQPPEVDPDVLRTSLPRAVPLAGNVATSTTNRGFVLPPEITDPGRRAELRRDRPASSFPRAMAKAEASL